MDGLRMILDKQWSMEWTLWALQSVTFCEDSEDHCHLITSHLKPQRASLKPHYESQPPQSLMAKELWAMVSLQI